ncbi:MAG TPA: CBS and ACT domain-containing protein [Syntrophomonadaceae bacterium]|nr:CBS and ACT domain-containing protein [Syntrophomonadaceae bacterium]HRX20792.1 CBS and ACT domain-containing protein [Syntrophomonadaceae bacterium]
MKVKDRMTTGVKTVQLETSVAEAFRMMKDNNIRRLPVLEKDKLVGIITLTDLNQASPSTATTLSIHELNYLLAKTKIKDILPKKQNVFTVSPENYIETAAKIMRQNKISGLPVIENGKLVGIVTETDIFDALIDILGVKKAHSRIDLYVRERPGTLAEITSMIAENGINILNTVVYYEDKKDRYKIILRLESLENDELIKKFAAKGYEIESVIVRAEEDK